MSEFEKIKSMIANVAISRLRSLCQREDFEIQEVSGEEQVFAPWMSLILISGPQIRLTFKAYFKSKTAAAFAAPLFRLPVEQILVDQAIDFIREYCNLTAGGLKKALADAGLSTGISLPVVTRGFDEIFFRADQGAGQSLHWTIQTGTESIGVSVFAEIFAPLGALDFSLPQGAT